MVRVDPILLRKKIALEERKLEDVCLDAHISNLSLRKMLNNKPVMDITAAKLSKTLNVDLEDLVTDWFIGDELDE